MAELGCAHNHSPIPVKSVYKMLLRDYKMIIEISESCQQCKNQLLSYG